MKTNDAGIAIIKRLEGFRSKPYLCTAGKPTIGYGTTVYPSGKKVTLQDKPITEAMALVYLYDYIERSERQIDALLKVTLTPNRYAAIVSFVYNVGIPAFRTSTLLKVINASPGSPGVRAEMYRWNKETDPVTKKKRVNKGLADRRKDEADLYFTP